MLWYNELCNRADVPDSFRLQKSGLTIEEFVLLLSWRERPAEFLSAVFWRWDCAILWCYCAVRGLFCRTVFFVAASNRISKLCGRTRRSLSCFSLGKRKTCRVFSAVFLKVRACPCGSLRCVKKGLFCRTIFYDDKQMQPELFEIPMRMRKSDSVEGLFCRTNFSYNKEHFELN